MVSLLKRRSTWTLESSAYLYLTYRRQSLIGLIGLCSKTCASCTPLWTATATHWVIHQKPKKNMQWWQWRSCLGKPLLRPDSTGSIGRRLPWPHNLIMPKWSNASVKCPSTCMNLSEFYCLTNLKFVASWDSLKTHSLGSFLQLKKNTLFTGKEMLLQWRRVRGWIRQPGRQQRGSSTFDMGLKIWFNPQIPVILKFGPKFH